MTMKKVNIKIKEQKEHIQNMENVLNYQGIH